MAAFIKRPFLVSLWLSGLVFSNFIRCSFEEPNAPSWDVEVTLPLISKVYTMAEIAEDESSLSLDSTGTLNFEVEAELENHYVGDQLNIKEVQKSFSLSLGSFNIDSPGTESAAVQLREIFSDADTFDGQTVVVPPFSFSSSKKELDPYHDFSYVVVESGQVSIRVQNDLPVPLGSPLTLEIWNADADTVIASATRAIRIDPGANRLFTIDLAGKTFTNHVAVRIFGDSPGSEGEPVQVEAEATFEVQATVSELTLTEALARIPTQIISNAEQVRLDEPLEIREARIETGNLSLTINGSLPVDAWIVYNLPDFISQTGVALLDSFFVARNSGVNLSIDLSNYSLQPQPAEIGQQVIRFSWTAKTVNTGDELVLVQSSDFVNATLNVSETLFSEVTARIAEKDIDISQNEIEFDIPVDLDSVFFETANLELLINNAINFPANIDVRIEGENESGAVSELTVRETIQSATAPGVPMMSRIVLNQQNSNIQEFISILPSLVRVFGNASLGSENWVGTVTKNDFINGTVRIVAPFALRLPPQNIESDAEEIELDDDVKSDIEDNLSAGTFVVEISNHLPLGAAVEFVFSQDSTQVFENPILQIGPIRTESAKLDSAGFVQQAEASETTVDLSEADMRTFLRSPLYGGLRVSVDGTGGQFVKVRGSDHVQIKSYGRIKMKINQD